LNGNGPAVWPAPPAGGRRRQSRAEVPIHDLATLLGSMAVDDFVRRFRARQTTLIRGDKPARLRALLDWPAVNDLLVREGFDVSRIKVTRNGALVGRFLYTEHDVPARLNLAALAQILGKGATLVIDGIDGMIPALRRLCVAVERTLRARAWINAYLTFFTGGGFGPHWDNHDVLILQISGDKRWRFFGPPEPSPLSEIGRDAVAPKAVIGEELLCAGDLLFIPRGHWHDAEVIGDSSVHLTMGLHSRTGVDWAAWLGAQAAAEEIFRRDLPLLGGRGPLHDHVARLKRRLIERVRTASVEEFLADSDAAREVPAVINLGLPAKLPASARVQLALRAAPRLSSTPAHERIALMLGSQTLELSRAAAAVLEHLADAGEITAGALRRAMNKDLSGAEVDAALAELARLCLVTVEVALAPAKSRRRSRGAGL